MRNWLNTMAKRCRVVGDIANKSRRIISITRMLVVKVPLETIVQIIGHRNLKTLSKYDRIAILKTKAIQKLLRQSYLPIKVGFMILILHMSLKMLSITEIKLVRIHLDEKM